MSAALAVVIGILAAVFPAVLLVKRLNFGKNRYLRLIKTLSGRADFHLINDDTDSRFEIRGSFEGHPVKIYFQKYTADLNAAALPSLAVSIERMDIRLDDMAIETNRFFLNSREMDIEFNDRDFDDALLITGGSTVNVRAALSPAARKYLKEFILHPDFLRLDTRRNLTTADSVKINLRISRDLNYTAVMNWIQIVMKFAVLANREGKPEDLLRRNYLDEKHIGPKIKYLESLGIVCKEMDTDDEIVTDAMASENPELMFTAAKNLGEKGYEYIPDIFKRADDFLKMKIIRYAAKKRITALSGFFSDEFPKLESALSRLDMLSYFSAAGVDIRMEKYMHQLLSEVPENDIRAFQDYYQKFIELLGRAGTMDSITFLNSIRKKFPERLINKAIAQIQDRIDVGDDGWLTIDRAAAGEGDLSLGEDEE